MIKGTRARERFYAVVMWVVSVILAAFLIGLGGLIIGDLPRVTDPVTVAQFQDQGEAARIVQESARLQDAGVEISERRDVAEQALRDARADYEAAQTTFDNWIATRQATTDPAQDPEVISRTRALDELKALERSAEQASDAVNTELYANDDAHLALSQAQEALDAKAWPEYEKARFFQGLGVFGLRLAFTLPLLLIAGLFMLQKKKGDYWPLKRGFVLFAAFAFFVELVPYLPEYGGYVRYGVGILVTLLAGHFVIRWMRNYLKTREASEAKAEVERKKSIQYDEALKKMAARTCPGCERTLPATGDVQTDFCMHCGMQLFSHCTRCDARKYAFFKFCNACGEPAQNNAAAVSS